MFRFIFPVLLDFQKSPFEQALYRLGVSTAIDLFRIETSFAASLIQPGCKRLPTSVRKACAKPHKPIISLALRFRQ
jgi:hypothetical protein